MNLCGVLNMAFFHQSSLLLFIIYIITSNYKVYWHDDLCPIFEKKGIKKDAAASFLY